MRKARSEKRHRMNVLFGQRIWYKRFLPRTLFGRAILIIVTPVLLMQSIAIWVFYDRYWNDVTSQLVFSVVAEIGMVVDQIETHPDQPEMRNAAIRSAARRADLLISSCADCILDSAPPPLLLDPFLIRKLNRTMRQDLLGRPYQISPDIRNEMIEILIQPNNSTMLSILIPLERLYTRATHIFLLWLLGSAVTLIGISILFMRNQIRPIRRLAIAAERFGKGRDVPDFKPEGAAEVRQAAVAFIEMRERIQKQIEQRTELLAGVSHDLRTPLTRMKLQLSMLPETPDLKDLRGDLTEMEVMIEAYLDFARGEGSEAEMRVDLSLMLKDIAAAAERSGTSVHTDITEEIELTLRPNEIRRAISNLIGNAKRYGKGEIWLAARPFRRVVEIVIEDNGPGIAESEMEDVFKPFIRVEESRNRDTGGVGLGLTIARDIARSHGGDITLSPSLHGGLKAVISLPV